MVLNLIIIGFILNFFYCYFYSFLSIPYDILNSFFIFSFIVLLGRETWTPFSIGEG